LKPKTAKETIQGTHAQVLTWPDRLHEAAFILQLAQSHPELARPYTAPMRDLATLARRAHQRGLDVVPKINFSQSHWIRGALGGRPASDQDTLRAADD